jgi:hypothetical protein
MAEQAEVKVKLVYDVVASGSADKFKAEIEKLKNQSSEASKEVKGIGKEENMKGVEKGSQKGSMALTALKSAAVVTAAAMAAIGYGAYEALSSANTQLEKMKATTGMMISMSPDKNISFERARQGAQAFEESFRKTAQAAGVTRDEIREAFSTIASQTQNTYMKRLTFLDAEKIAGDMAKVSRVMPGGLGELTKEYENLKTGTFASMGSIVRMITMTGVLKGNAVEVARQLAGKDMITRMQIAEEAMAKMAKQVPKAMGVEGIKNAFSSVKDSTLENFGMPIINSVLPLFNKAVDWFERNDARLQQIGAKTGDFLGMIFGRGSDMLETFYDVFTRSGGAGDVISEAGDKIKDAFKWIYDHRMEIAEGVNAGAKALWDVAKVVGKVVGGIKDATLAMKDSLSDKLGSGDPLIKAGVARKMVGVEGEVKTLKGARSPELQEKIDAIVEEAGKGGSASRKRAQEWADAVQNMADKTTESVSSFDRLSESLSSVNSRGENQLEFLSKRMGMEQAANAMQAEQIAAADAFVVAYNEAKKKNDTAALEYAESLVKNSEKMQQSLLESANKFEGGALEFAKRVGDPTMIKKWTESAKAGLGTGKLNAQVNFNGATINIKQDFRDQDPDRVAIVFKDSLANAAVNRTQSMMQTPFGL